MQLCFATNNAHKLQEIRQILGKDFLIQSLSDVDFHHDIPETCGTIEGNSLQKARFVHDLTKLSCFADDSGLEVMVLNGEPGVDSAHYAGPHRSDLDNINLLLKNLDDASSREAQFKTVISLVTESEELQFTGVIKGLIDTAPQGTKGFGYDPIFTPHGYDKTFAEMSPEEKNSISHRGIAFRKLASYLGI